MTENTPANTPQFREVNEHLYVDPASQTLLYSPEYEAMLQNVQSVIVRANQLVSQDLENADDDQLDTIRNEITDLIKEAKVVDTTRKDLKSFMKSTTDTVLDIFDKHAESLGYGQLPLIQAKVKDMRDKQLAHRKEARWAELKETFDATIVLYPNIVQHTPMLADFSNFRLHHPQLVTGSKTKKIGDKQRAEVATYLDTVSNLLQLWETNQFQLTTIYHNQLLSALVNNPSKEVFLETQTTLLAQQQRDEQIRAEQERIRQERLAAQQTTLQQQQSVNGSEVVPLNELPSHQSAVPVNPLLQEQPPKQTISQLARGWLNSYITHYPDAYSDIVTNVSARVCLVHDITHQLDRPTSMLCEYLAIHEQEYFRDDLIMEIIKQVALL